MNFPYLPMLKLHGMGPKFNMGVSTLNSWGIFFKFSHTFTPPGETKLAQVSLQSSHYFQSLGQKCQFQDLAGQTIKHIKITGYFTMPNLDQQLTSHSKPCTSCRNLVCDSILTAMYSNYIWGLGPEITIFFRERVRSYRDFNPLSNSNIIGVKYTTPAKTNLLSPEETPILFEFLE